MRSACQRVFAVLQQTASASVRGLATLTGLPRSSVHRYTRGILVRNQFPESHLWERPEGYAWLCVLVCATVYVFGSMRGVGAETLSYFFTLLRLQTQIGVSPSAIRTLRRRMDTQLLAYRETQERELQQTPQTVREICVGVDETFFEEMLLVCMDLSSGDILVEEAAPNRTYATWQERTQAVMQPLGLKVRYMVSDRARALIKLAHDGFGCASMPDLFHTLREITKVLGGRLHRRLHRVQTHLATATATLATLVQEKPPRHRSRPFTGRLPH